MPFLSNKIEIVFYNIYNGHDKYRCLNTNKEKQMKKYLLELPDDLHKAVRIQLAKDSMTFRKVVLNLLSDYAKSNLLPAEKITKF